MTGASDTLAELSARRPASEKVSSGFVLLRHAALEGGFSIWTPNPDMKADPNTLQQPGVWTNVTLLGDVTTYFSAGTPEHLLAGHKAKVRQAIMRISRNLTAVVWFFVATRWLLWPASALWALNEYLAGTEVLEISSTSLAAVLAGPIAEVIRQLVSFWIGNWLR
jgi:hypothetical protein